MVVDPYKARKRYTVTESLDLIVSVKQRNPIRIFLKLKCDWWCSYFDMTDEYRTLSTYITPKTISRHNQKTNTTPQLYCTLST
jgi:hypothetical protein